MKTLPVRPLYDPNGTRAMGYYDWTDLPYYYELATQYATSDRQFASVGARTPVNRMYIMAASSYGNVDFGPIPQTALTIFDRLTAAGISWKYYYEPTIPAPEGLNISGFNVSKTNPSQIVTTDEYFTDLQNGTLPVVSFIESDGSGFDEHPQDNIQEGALHASQLINAFINSSYYATGVFLLSYDEHGGLYDHVPPITVVAPDNIAPKPFGRPRGSSHGTRLHALWFQSAPDGRVAVGEARVCLSCAAREYFASEIYRDTFQSGSAHQARRIAGRHDGDVRLHHPGAGHAADAADAVDQPALQLCPRSFAHGTVEALANPETKSRRRQLQRLFCGSQFDRTAAEGLGS